MGNIQVTVRPQAIYPDGFQEPFVIKNNGPYTIYVGQDTSVNTESMAVPPSGTLAWDSQRPLYVVGSALMGSGYSSITIERNSQTTDFNNAFDAPLFVHSLGGVGESSENLIECTAFESLILTIEDAGKVLSAAAIGPNNRYDVSVMWFDSQGNFLSTDSAQVPWTCSPALSSGNNVAWANTEANPIPAPGIGRATSRVVFKVKGSSCFVWVVNALGILDTPKWTLTGSTRELKPRMTFTNPDGLPWIGAGLAGSSLYNGSDFFTIQNGSSGYNFANVVLPPIGRHWRIAMRNGAAIIGAGTLNIRSAYDNTYPLDTFPIAVAGAGIIQDFETTIPIYEPIQVSIPNAPTQAGPVAVVDFKMTFTCLDYDT